MVGWIINQPTTNMPIAHRKRSRIINTSRVLREIWINKDISRFQIAFQRELYYLLDNEYLSPEGLDAAVIWGLALRMIVVGAVQRIDFGGLDLSVRGLARASQSTPIDYQPKKLLELVEKGNLGVKTGRGFYDYKGRTEAEVCHDRDIRLLKLLKILQETDIAGPII